MKKLLFIISALFLCGGDAFAIPCAVSYEKYRKELIKSGAIPIKCLRESASWDEACLNGFSKAYPDKPYATWIINDVRFSFPLTNPNNPSSDQGLCVYPSFFWDDVNRTPSRSELEKKETKQKTIFFR